MRISLVGALMGVLLTFGSPVIAQMSVPQGRDGTNGTVTGLGHGSRISSDSHGNAGTIQELNGGMQPYQSSSPEGPGRPGTFSSLTPSGGSVPSTPPQNSTSPYSLSSKPHGPLVTPSQPSSPTAPVGSRTTVGAPGAATWGSAGSR